VSTLALILIIAGGALAVLLVIVFAIWAHQFTKVGPNEVLIISGRRKRGRGYRIIRGGGTFVRPIREKVQTLSLELLQFDVRTADTYSSHGVPVQVDGVCMVKVDSSDAGVERAAEQFLSRGREDIVRTAMQAIEGHLRSGIGSLSIEDIYRERQKLVAKVRDLAEPDLDAMGLSIVSLTIRNVTDKQGYIEALGRPRTAEVKRDAVRGEAEAEREARAARYAADTQIEASRRDFETSRAKYELEVQSTRAEADLAYELQRAISSQQVRAEKLQIEIVERVKTIELMEAEVNRRRRELEAQVLEPAQAEARKIEMLADAEKERLAALGAGEADAERLRGLAQADAMAAKAKAWGDYNEAAIADRLFSILPQLAAAVSEPLSRTDKIVMIGGNGSGPGASKITGEVAKVVAELPEMLEALTGVKLAELLKRIPTVEKAGGGEADAEAEAEEVS
jgi:flotillin